MIISGNNPLNSSLVTLVSNHNNELCESVEKRVKALLDLNNPLVPFSNTCPQAKIGLSEIFFDNVQDVRRSYLIWYPIAEDALVKESSNSLDSFLVGRDAPIVREQQKMPVIVISHGWSGNPWALSWLIREFVRANFLVIGIQHRDFIDQEMHINHWMRAGDVSVVLDHFTSSPPAASADLNKIGIAGFSLGGTTALWVSGARATNLDSLMPGPEYANPDQFEGVNKLLPGLNKEMMSKNWRDSRIKAAFIMAPAWSWIFDRQSLAEITIPSCIIGGASDEVVKTAANAGFFAEQIPGSIYQEIPGKVGHFIFRTAPSKEKRETLDPLGELSFQFDDDESVNRSLIQSKVAAAAVYFFESRLRDV